MATGNTCGVGGWGGPVPGDPSNNAILSATPAFGGIDVRWEYPTTNPQAVAYTKLYRGLTADFGTALFLHDIGGSFFYDKLETAVQYFYWIRIVSKNTGVAGELIGPASAVARPAIGDMIEQLTGQIDTGMLATSLRTPIDRIPLIGQDLLTEVQDRLNAELIASGNLAGLSAAVDSAMAFAISQKTLREDGDSALAESIDLVAVAFGDNLAAAQSSLHSEITTVDGRVTTLAGVVDSVIAASGTGVTSAQLAAAESSLTALIDVVDDRVTTLASVVDTVETTAGDNLAAAQSALTSSIVTERNRITALSSAVDTVETEAAGNLASAQTTLTTNINLLGGKVDEIGALYTVKLNVNGLQGGLGVYNDGTTVEAGFDVDRFWVGRTNADSGRKPFIIDNGIVYVNQAVIPLLTADKINGYNLQIMSGGFGEHSYPAAGQTGFYLGPEGLMIGNQNTPGSGYFQIDANGDVSSPQFNIIGGVATFAGSLAAGVLDSSQIIGSNYTFSTPGLHNLPNMPYTGTVRFTIVGGGGGGASGGLDTAGRPGLPGFVYTNTVTGIPIGTALQVQIGAGGAGAPANPTSSTAVAGSAGALSFMSIGAADYFAAGGAAGSPIYHATGRPNVVGYVWHAADYGDAVIGYVDGPGTAAAVSGSVAGTRALASFGSGTNFVNGAFGASYVPLQGGNGVRGGPGGGAAPSAVFIGSRGFYISPVQGEGAGGAPTISGGRGGDGYAFIEIFNPNAVVLRSEWDNLMTALANQSIGTGQ